MSEHASVNSGTAESIPHFDDELLRQLAADEFSVSIGIVPSPEALRRWLVRNPLVQRLERAISLGTLSEESVRKFADALTRDFRRGERFPHELALAAIAVALEGVRTDFAEEYLLDLAKLNIVEMPMAPRVARICATRRSSRPRTDTKEVAFERTLPQTGGEASSPSSRVRSPSLSVAYMVMTMMGAVIVPVHASTNWISMRAVIDHAET